MTEDALRLDRVELASERYEGLVSSGNRPVLRDEQLRGEYSRQVADYLAAVRNRERLPPHAFPGGFFADAFPASAITELAAAQDETVAPLVPVAPIGQRTSLTDLSVDEPSWLQTMPDLGRRVQLWWDELAPGHPPLRADETIRFMRRAELLGRVERIEVDRFTTTVWDQAHPGTAEQAEFFLDQLSASDRDRLAEGAMFYWTLGYAENVLGERTSASRLRMKRRRRSYPPELQREAENSVDALLRALDLPPERTGSADG